MFPTFHLGPWQVPTYNTVYSLALVVVGMVAFRRLRRLAEPPARQMRELVAVILGSFVGTYAVGLVPTVQHFAQTGEWVWTGQASFLGTLAGGLVVAVLVRRGHPIPLGRALDLGGTPWPLLLAIGRIGCLGAGCCYGKPTTSWLGMWLRNLHGEWAVRYPTQILSGVANLLIFGLLLAVERYGQKRVGTDRGWPFDGFLFLLYVGLFCAERFSMEWLRGDVVPVVGSWSWVHLATLGGMVAVAAIVARRLVLLRTER
ncbi:MAG: prolipoprotein diacylglyceryl transferase [Anaerolineae bacterium]